MLKKFIDLLSLHLSTTLNDQQKRNFVRNLLQEMKGEKTICRVQGKVTRAAAWELAKSSGESEN